MLPVGLATATHDKQIPAAWFDRESAALLDGEPVAERPESERARTAECEDRDDGVVEIAQIAAAFQRGGTVREAT